MENSVPLNEMTMKSNESIINRCAQVDEVKAIVTKVATSMITFQVGLVSNICFD